MHPRAAHLIEVLGLAPHPEGGYFREVFRSPHTVHPGDTRTRRSALTTIYFLLPHGQQSQWHRVASDEAWHFYEGEPLDLFWVEVEGAMHRETLSGEADGGRPVAVVPAGLWQAARPRGAYSLVGCTVGPGFDFEDFEMVTPATAQQHRLPALPALPPDGLP